MMMMMMMMMIMIYVQSYAQGCQINQCGRAYYQFYHCMFAHVSAKRAPVEQCCVQNVDGNGWRVKLHCTRYLTGLRGYSCSYHEAEMFDEACRIAGSIVDVLILRISNVSILHYLHQGRKGQ